MGAPERGEANRNACTTHLASCSAARPQPKAQAAVKAPAPGDGARPADGGGEVRVAGAGGGGRAAEGGDVAPEGAGEAGEVGVRAGGGGAREGVVGVRRGRVELPPNIRIVENRYMVLVNNKIKERSFYASAKTLEEAEAKLAEFNEKIKLLDEKEKEEHFKKLIVRNEKGQAIVPIRNKKGEIIDETVVSDECWHDVTQYFWSKTKKGDYYKAIVDGKKIELHRYIMKAKPGEIVDHINENGNTTKINTFDNLRFNSASGNSHNTKKRTGTSSQYFGVSYNKNALKFEAQIKKDKVHYGLGQYDKEIKAAIAYNIMAKHLYGEFSRINKIEQSDIDLYYNEIYEKINIKHKLCSD